MPADRGPLRCARAPVTTSICESGVGDYRLLGDEVNAAVPRTVALCRTRPCYHLGKRIWSRIQSPGIAVTFLMTAVCCCSRPRQSHTSRSWQADLPPPRIFIRDSFDYIGLLAVVWVRRTAVPSVRVATKSTRRVMKPSSGQLLNQNQVHS